MSNNPNVLPIPPSELPNSSTDESVDDFVNDSTNECTDDFVDEVIHHTGCKLANLIFQEKFVKKYSSTSNKTETNVGAAQNNFEQWLFERARQRRPILPTNLFASNCRR